jgi:hypothetical protein
MDGLSASIGADRAATSSLIRTVQRLGQRWFVTRDAHVPNGMHCFNRAAWVHSTSAAHDGGVVQGCTAPRRVSVFVQRDVLFQHGSAREDRLPLTCLTRGDNGPLSAC